MRIDVQAEAAEDGWRATVRVDDGGTRTRHVVTVGREDLQRYGASDIEELVRRSFEFLLEREPNTRVLREFRITEIERYFPEFPQAIRR